MHEDEMKTLLAVTILGFAFDCHSQIASGGSFSLSQSALAGGGRTGSNGAFTVEGTAAQSAAGGLMQGGQLSVYSGFWTPPPFAPTAASVSVSGRIVTAAGQGISGVSVTLLGSDGVTSLSRSSSFGYYSFPEVLAGDTYILTVTSKKYFFAQPTIVVHVVDQLDNIDFVADPW